MTRHPAPPLCPPGFIIVLRNGAWTAIYPRERLEDERYWLPSAFDDRDVNAARNILTLALSAQRPVEGSREVRHVQR